MWIPRKILIVGLVIFYGWLFNHLWHKWTPEERPAGFAVVAVIVLLSTVVMFLLGCTL
jgi:hypothetical protein